MAAHLVQDQTTYESFISSSIPQLKDKVPSIYWESLFRKLKSETYDAGEKFSIMLDEDDGTHHVIVTDENGVQASDSDSIFLIDHAWMYERQYAKTHLDTIPGLAERMAALMGVQVEVDDDFTKEQQMDEILDKMWCFNQTYRMGMVGFDGQKVTDMSSVDDRSISQWYILDEFGSKIQHSDDPTCQTALFYYIPTGLSFTLMWPSRDLEYGEELTRDYQPAIKDPYLRKFHLLPWQDCDVEEEIEKHAKEIENEEKSKLSDYKEILPDGISTPQREPENGVYKVYTNSDQVLDFLTDPRFKFMDNRYEADILWLMEHVKDYKSLEQKGQMINQIPFDYLLNCKDQLAEVCQRSGIQHEEFKELENDELLCRGPYWLPVTFNLNTELPEFIQHYKRREKRGLDNHWLVKPWNMGRGLDLHLTKNLNHLIRMAETGPKIASKYIDKQVLFHRDDVGYVKFDLRYHLFLRSVDPIELYVDRIFWTRFANKEFSLEDLHDYEKHFTVMNYRKTELKQIHHDEFIKMWDVQYPNYTYDNVERELFKMFKEIIQAAVKEPPPKGLGNYKNSSAFFGLDLMLKWADDGSKRMVPQILEFNFLPDCARACRYYPNFFNFMFSLMFLGDPNGWPVDRLL